MDLLRTGHKNRRRVIQLSTVHAVQHCVFACARNPLDVFSHSSLQKANLLANVQVGDIVSHTFHVFRVFFFQDCSLRLPRP